MLCISDGRCKVGLLPTIHFLLLFNVITLSWWFFFLSFRYECTWLECLQCGHLPALPAHRHCNTNIQVNVVTYWKALLCFSTFLLVFFLFNLWTYFFFFLFLILGGDHILLCSVSLRVWGSTRVECAVRHLINSERLSLFLYFLT